MANYQVCDLAAGKGFTIAQSNEHLRNAYKGAYNRNISVNFDPTRVDLNFEVAQGGKIVPVNKQKSITRRIKESLKKRGIKDPNDKKDIPDRRTVANFILGGSREQMHRLVFGDQKVDLKRGADNRDIERCEGIEKWAIDMYKFMASKYGEENIAAFVVHLDEVNPHVHCTVLPVTERNKISWKHVFNGDDKESYKKYLLNLHDEIEKVNAKYGLERGRQTSTTGAKHRTTEQYREWLDDMAKQIEEEIKKGEQIIDENKQTIYELNKERKLAETRIKGLTTMIANLEAKKNQIEESIRELEEKMKEGKLSEAETKQRTEELRQELQAVLENIKDKRNKLNIAEKELLNISYRRNAMVDEMDELKNKIENSSETV